MTKRKMPSIKQISEWYMAEKRPSDCPHDLWELVQDENIRRFMAYFLGVEYIPKMFLVGIRMHSMFDNYIKHYEKNDKNDIVRVLRELENNLFR